MSFLKSSLLKSLSANALSKIFNICSQLIIIPFFLKYWGKECYGEWLLLSIVPNYLTLSDFGLNVTSVTELCKLVIDKKYEKARIVFKAVNGFFLLLGTFVIILYMCFINIIDLNSFLNLKKISNLDASLSTFFLLTTVFISISWGLLTGVFRAEGRFDKQLNFTTLASVLDFLIILFTLFNGFSVVFLAGLQMIMRLILYFLLIIIISKKYSWFHYGVIFDFCHIRKLLPTSVYYMFLTMGHAMILQGTAFIVGKHLGSAILVSFNTIRTLVNSIKSFSSVIYLSFVPEFTISIYKKDRITAIKSYEKMLWTVGIQASSMSLILLFLGKMIFDFWTRKELQIINPFFYYMLLSIIFQSLWNAATMVPLSINENKKIRLFALFSVLFVVILYFTVPYFGLNTIGIGLVIFDLAMLLYVMNATGKILYK